MKKQEALNEGLILDDENINFHRRQLEEPYRSTVKFLDFLKKNLAGSRCNKICDLGCGAGAVLDYVLTQGKEMFADGIGIDICAQTLQLGNEIISSHHHSTCKLVEGDIFDLHHQYDNSFDGVISLQTFNILPDYHDMVKVMFELSNKWIAFSTLGFTGLIDYKIKLFDYTKDKDSGCAEVFYNIYSLPIMKNYLEELGFKKVVWEEFVMDIDLPCTNPMGRGTYTVKTDEGKRIQISGGMMMPWYFVFASK